MEAKSPKIRPMLSEETLRDRVRELGVQIQRDWGEEPLTVVSVLTGSLVFTADLIRALGDSTVYVELVRARSYVGTTSDKLQLELSLLDPTRLRGRHVLVVDEMLDTGKTLYRLLDQLRDYEPARIESAVLLRKEGCLLPQYPVEPRYIGFEIENKFVVGYGLDYDGHYRHLSYVGELLQEAESKTETVSAESGSNYC